MNPVFVGRHEQLVTGTPCTERARVRADAQQAHRGKDLWEVESCDVHQRGHKAVVQLQVSAGRVAGKCEQLKGAAAVIRGCHKERAAVDEREIRGIGREMAIVAILFIRKRTESSVYVSNSQARHIPQLAFPSSSSI